MKIFLLFILTALLIGCGGDDKASPETAQPGAVESAQNDPADVFSPLDPIMPLGKGYIWAFQLSGYDTVAMEMVAAGIDTFQVINDSIIDGETWFFVTGLGPNRGVVQNRDDGFWFIRPGDEPFLFAKYPAVPGEEYRHVIGGVSVYNLVAEVGIEVTVPAGTFTCYKYTQIVGPRRMTTDYYFSPGAGLIKSEIHSPAGDHMLFTAELTDKNF